jgi:regulator of protease activity HflC (stomatin/prohibitin superfamily)
MDNSSGVREIPRGSYNGYLAIAIAFVLVLLALRQVGHVAGEPYPSPFEVLPIPALMLAAAFLLAGLYMLQPNEAALLLLFGAYRGTDRSSGLRWTNPFLQKRKVSLRAHNLASEKLKVNDKRGNPIEIAAAIIWRVQDTARAVFDVQNYDEYVRIQSEAAVRHLASNYAYDETEDPMPEPEGAPRRPPQVTLRASQDRVAAALLEELRSRLARAGIAVEDARLTHLAYAPEIAQVMLRRQQAQAIIDARKLIVDGAVTMVERALAKLAAIETVHLDDDRRATMVSNLLVILCADRDAQPVINAGTLYS